VSAGDEQNKQFIEAGLVRGLRGKARQSRLELLRELEDDGYSIDELKAAAAEDRLVLLRLDRVLGGEARYSARQLAELSGMTLDYVLAARTAVGLASPDPDEIAFGDLDLEATKVVRTMRDAGIPEEGILEITRVLGFGLAQGAEAIRMMMARLFLSQEVSERDLALLNAQAARELLPRLSPLLQYTLTIHLREQVRSLAISLEDLAAGASPNTLNVFVAFADMVGFTRLGESIEVTELGPLVNRLTDLALEARKAPTRIVKTIGDAVMLVATTAEPLLQTTLDLVALAEEADGDFPPLRAGLAGGVALSREGDWYGRPVNLASRVTSVARAGSVLATEEVRDAAGDAYSWSAAGEFRLKGFKARLPLFRARLLAS
jgi:adenylate cyclase